MFNPLEAHKLIAALAGVLREAADPDRQQDPYARSQLLSASSIARHIAAEQAAAPDLLGWLRERLLAALDEDPSAPSAAVAARERIAVAASGTEIGAALAALLDELGPQDEALRVRVHAVLAAMADREVAALAGA